MSGIYVRVAARARPTGSGVHVQYTQGLPLSRGAGGVPYVSRSHCTRKCQAATQGMRAHPHLQLLGQEHITSTACPKNPPHQGRGSGTFCRKYAVPPGSQTSRRLAHNVSSLSQGVLGGLKALGAQAISEKSTDSIGVKGLWIYGGCGVLERL